MRPRILVADDDTCFREAVVSYLQDEGYDVLAAATGSEALAIAIGEGVSLCLLDLRMPGGSGADVLRELKIRRPDLKVLVISGSAALMDPQSLASLGLDTAALLAKPLPRLAVLADRVASLLREGV